MRFQRSHQLVGAALLAAMLTGASLSIAATPSSTTLKGKQQEPGGLITVGTQPAGFTLPDIDGKSVSLESYAGSKAVLLVFWSFFCGPCREEIPLIDQTLKKYADKGVEVLAINLDGPKMDKAVRKYMASNGFTFRVLWENIDGVRYATADGYGVAGTPTLILVGKSGKVSWTHVGRAEASDLDAEFQKSLQ